MSEDDAPGAGSAEGEGLAVEGEGEDSLAGASGAGTSPVVLAMPIRDLGVRSSAAKTVSPL